MAKTQEELNALKEEVVTLNEKLKELTEEELAQVTGGSTCSSDLKQGLQPVLESLKASFLAAIDEKSKQLTPQ